MSASVGGPIFNELCDLKYYKAGNPARNDRGAGRPGPSYALVLRKNEGALVYLTSYTSPGLLFGHLATAGSQGSYGQSGHQASTTRCMLSWIWPALD